MSRPRTLRSRRREATRTALIEKAEALIGELGVEAVSTRQIGAAIGSSNNNVVAYYFGSKEDLITAIYRHRLPDIEKRRAELLADLDASSGGSNLFALMYALWRPLYEQRGDDGNHSYATFLAGVARSGWAWTRYSLDADYPVVNMVVERIRPHLPPMDDGQFHSRLMATAAMISSTLAAMGPGPQQPTDTEAMFRDLIRMAAAALQAPAEVY